jgi:hypothetical protein
MGLCENLEGGGQPAGPNFRPKRQKKTHEHPVIMEGYATEIRTMLLSNGYH